VPKDKLMADADQIRGDHLVALRNHSGLADSWCVRGTTLIRPLGIEGQPAAKCVR
jgi:hypothetical protein